MSPCERVAATGVEAQRVFAADKVANVIEARDEYALIQEDVDLGQPVDLDEKILGSELSCRRAVSRAARCPAATGTPIPRGSRARAR